MGSGSVPTAGEGGIRIVTTQRNLTTRKIVGQVKSLWLQNRGVHAPE